MILTTKILLVIAGGIITYLSIEAPALLDAIKDLFLWDLDEL